ncbi:hypothetical protein H072_7340 [Dactylellina haptotyla CBS 200.50]|uniref:Uncharacterized protein n=1 Tax=Dactylellina haptotyla (strain CBS 200.50) TaxID=1284197 RepID=S8A7D6_DACHA|nr:hypothetical protein H072_7340 [Dactylellina haptotyla CBS 200.50]
MRGDKSLADDWIVGQGAICFGEFLSPPVHSLADTRSCADRRGRSLARDRLLKRRPRFTGHQCAQT